VPHVAGVEPGIAFKINQRGESSVRAQHAAARQFQSVLVSDVRSNKGSNVCLAGSFVLQSACLFRSLEAALHLAVACSGSLLCRCPAPLPGRGGHKCLALGAILKPAGWTLTSGKGPELGWGSVCSAGRLRMRRRPGWGWWNAPSMSCSSLSMSSTKRKVSAGGGRAGSGVWMGRQLSVASGAWRHRCWLPLHKY